MWDKQTREAVVGILFIFVGAGAFMGLIQGYGIVAGAVSGAFFIIVLAGMAYVLTLVLNLFPNKDRR